jgi:hypothetical protein
MRKSALITSYLLLNLFIFTGCGRTPLSENGKVGDNVYTANNEFYGTIVEIDNVKKAYLIKGRGSDDYLLFVAFADAGGKYLNLKPGAIHQPLTTPAIKPQEPPVDPYVAQHGPPPLVSGNSFYTKSGGMRNVLRPYLKDADSLEVESVQGPFQTPNGWVIEVSYRAKNSFGAYSRESCSVLVEQGVVVSVGR